MPMMLTRIVNVSLILFALLSLATLNVGGAQRTAEDGGNAYERYSGCQIIQVFPSNESENRLLSKFVAAAKRESGAGAATIEIWRHPRKLGHPTDVFTCTNALREFLQNNHIEFSIENHDISSMLQSERPETQRASNKLLQNDLSPSHASRHPSTLRRNGVVVAAKTRQRSDVAFDLGTYHTYNEMVAFMRSVARRHPTLVELSNIGLSFEGRSIPLLKIGHASENRSVKPAIFIDAGIHAREWIAPAVALYLIDQLTRNASYAALLREVDFFIVPTANPDGYEYSRLKQRFWRRTRSQRNTTDCVGADPNRNFPFRWRESGTSTNPCSDVYGGDRALSEPECAALARFLIEHRHRIGAYLTLHSYGNMILYPWGYAYETYPENVAELKEVANEMAQAIKDAGGDLFQVGTAADVLYPASGASDDFAKSEGIPLVYTMELTPDSFMFPAERIVSTAETIVPGIIVCATRVSKRGARNGEQN